MRDVYVAGVGMTRFAKQPGRSLKDLTAEAVNTAMKDAGQTTGDVQACYFGNAVAGSMTGQEMLAGQFLLRPLGFGGIPVFNVENACASASTAFHLAWQAVATGVHDAVLAVGAEKMTHPDKARSFAAIGGSVDVETMPADLPAGRSFLMDMYAESSLRYMEQTGATRTDFARVVVKNQRHGMLNPAAQYGGELTVEQILAAREIVWPFTLQMCSPISDGAAAALLVSDELRLPGAVVAVLASVLRSAPADGGASVTGLAAGAAYEAAGLGPADLDCAEVHDAAASAELVIYEQLGLAELGGGAALIRSGQTALGGSLPVNTSGGLLARGHPIGATGLAQIVEAVVQLRGTAGDRQVPAARFALTQNAGGWHGTDNVASVVNIFGRRAA
jgi:acetyl-CoA acetyltransferase